MIAQYAALPGRVSGQNILNAMNRAVKQRRGGFLKWQQSGARSSSTFDLLRASPASSFRRKKNSPRINWSRVPGAHLQISHTTGFIDPDRFYIGTVRIEIQGRDDRETFELKDELDRIISVLPKQLEHCVTTKDPQ